VMRLAARRLADLCERLQLPGSLSQQAYTLVEHTLYEHTALLYNRHLDQAGPSGYCSPRHRMASDLRNER